MAYFIGIACPWLLVAGLDLMWQRRRAESAPQASSPPSSYLGN